MQHFYSDEPAQHLRRIPMLEIPLSPKKRYTEPMKFILLALLTIAINPSFAADLKGNKMKTFDLSQFKKPSKDELKKTLNSEQFSVTQEEGTERPFKNTYWDNKAEGIYVDIVSGEPLFSSLEKYDSGTGWPSFWKPLEESNIATKEDKRLFFGTRVEVRSKHADSHLGHVFDDGPAPTGKRYCMNSASMRFIAKEDLEKEGYGKYSALFSKEGKKVKKEEAVFAGGCFWGVEELIRKLPGVLETKVGYTGGFTDNPTYDQVKTGNTGHAESIQVIFDPEKISYEDILKYFFKLHDPTTVNQQGNDKGSQYRSAIFYENETQKKVAEKVKDLVDKSGAWKKKVVTEILPASKFYPAEDYHQDYLQKQPNGYTCHYVRPLKF